MKERVILVTGGAGYIGSHVCKALAESGFFPVTYDNLCSGNEAAVRWGPFERGDIRDRVTLGAVIRAWRPAAIMHFAALMRVGDSVFDPAKFYDNNTYGSLCLLEEARAHGIGDVVFSSTAAVYGYPKRDRLLETAPLRPVNPYGQTKLAAENMIRDFSSAYGLRYAILRYFNAAGADPECETGTAYKKDSHLVPLLMRVAAGIKPEIEIFGTDYDTPDGTAIRDYIHVSDLAQAHILALRHIMERKDNITLNLGTSRGYSVNEVVSTARTVTGHALPAVEKPRRSGDPAMLVADASRAENILAWKPQYSDLETIIATAWAWRQKQSALAAAQPFEAIKKAA